MSATSVQDFILQSEQNCRIAAEVAAAWPTTRVYIANEFLRRLSEKLLIELPGWQSTTWQQFFEDKYANFYVEKKTWGSEYSITLQAVDYGESILFGIQRDHENVIVSQRPLSPELYEVFRLLYPSAKANKYWDAAVHLRNPASDWTPPEVLWRMHTDVKFLDAVADQMLAVAKAAESAIDRLTQKQ